MMLEHHLGHVGHLARLVSYHRLLLMWYLHASCLYAQGMTKSPHSTKDKPKRMRSTTITYGYIPRRGAPLLPPAA
jgi:hypothetical protein